jgi:hypothetical protein
MLLRREETPCSEIASEEVGAFGGPVRLTPLSGLRLIDEYVRSNSSRAAAGRAARPRVFNPMWRTLVLAKGRLKTAGESPPSCVAH